MVNHRHFKGAPDTSVIFAVMELNNNDEKKKNYPFVCGFETVIVSVSCVYDKWEETAHTI